MRHGLEPGSKSRASMWSPAWAGSVNPSEGPPVSHGSGPGVELVTSLSRPPKVRPEKGWREN